MTELEKEGIKVKKQINTRPTITKFNKNYFKTRIKKTGYGLK
jgi:GTP cyclohydrolase II